MFDALIGLGYGIIIFAVVVGVGSIVLYNFSGTQAVCGTLTPYNSTTGTCYNSTSGTGTTPSGTSYTNMNYMLTQLGSAGLAGWTPAIIAISVGLLFLGAFMIKGKGKGRY